jgi:hypothetical protein
MYLNTAHCCRVLTRPLLSAQAEPRVSGFPCAFEPRTAPQIIGRTSDDVDVLRTNDRQLLLCQITPGCNCRGYRAVRYLPPGRFSRLEGSIPVQFDRPDQDQRAWCHGGRQHRPARSASGQFRTTRSRRRSHGSHPVPLQAVENVGTAHQSSAITTPGFAVIPATPSVPRRSRRSPSTWTCSSRSSTTRRALDPLAYHQSDRVDVRYRQAAAANHQGPDSR